MSEIKFRRVLPAHIPLSEIRSHWEQNGIVVAQIQRIGATVIICEVPDTTDLAAFARAVESLPPMPGMPAATPAPISIKPLGGAS